MLLLCLDFMESRSTGDFIWTAPVFTQSSNSIPPGPETLKLIFCGEGAALSPLPAPGHFSTGRTLSQRSSDTVSDVLGALAMVIRIVADMCGTM